MRAAFGARARARSIIAMAVAALALAAQSAPAGAAECPNRLAGPGSIAPEELAAATLCVVNEERAAAGRAPLTGDRSLAATGSAYAADMVADGDFQHQSARSGGVADRVLDVSGSLDRWLELGENLGWGTLDQATPEAIVAGWMRSPTHRANVLYSRFTRLGVGVTGGSPSGRSPSDALTYVAVFGRDRAKRCTPRRRAAARARGARVCRARR